MCSPNIVRWCFVLLLVVSSSKSQENSTNNDERSDNLTVQYDSLVSSIKYRNDEIDSTRCNSCEDSFANDNKMQYESSVNSTKHDCKINDSFQNESWEYITKNNEQNDQKMSVEFHVNSTEINGDFMSQEINDNLTKTVDEKNSKSNELYGNIDNSTISACDYLNCIQFCCPRGEKLSLRGNCITGQDSYLFPQVYENENKSLDELFALIVHDPCASRKLGRGILAPNKYQFLANGSLLYHLSGKLILPMSYCLAIFERKVFDVVLCVNRTNDNNTDQFPKYVSACLLVSIPFFLLTFIVYSILPELQNFHGYTLRAHVASLFIMYVILYAGQQIHDLIQWKYCVHLAYIFNFSVLSSFLWLNIMCFNIWWTFRELRPNRGSIKRDKKDFVIYSYYAWGVPFIHSVFCAIMDYLPGIPENWIRPNMCKTKFWIENSALNIFSNVPIGITIISNIYFFIVTTLTILNRKKFTAHQMRDSESKQHNENKQRFYMYLKLFILMGITWIMELMADIFDAAYVSPVVWYPTNIINALQGVIIFIIFVCTKKNKQLLLKRFSGRNCCSFCKILTNNDNMASTTSTSLEPATLSMREIRSINL